jgi:hypothetical protein
MKRTHSKKNKYKGVEEQAVDLMNDKFSIWPSASFSDFIEKQKKKPQITKDYLKNKSIEEGYEQHEVLPRRPDIRPSPERVAQVMKANKANKAPPIPPRQQKQLMNMDDFFDVKPPKKPYKDPNPLAGTYKDPNPLAESLDPNPLAYIKPYKDPNPLAELRNKDDFYNVNPTDLNSVYSYPEIIYNPAGIMSYLNPQDPLMPRQIFSNTQYINALPSTNNPIYKNPLNPYLISIMNAEAIKPVKKVVDSLIPSSIEDGINYNKELTKLPTKKDIEEYYNVSENKAITKDVENINFARKELSNMKSGIDSFFDGADLDRKSFDRGDDPMSSYQKMKSATSSHYDNYSGKVINPQSVVNDDDIGATVNGLNLAALPEGNELLGRVNNTYMDPYYNTNTNNLKADLVSQLNFNNLLLGENSIYARPKDMDLLESSKSDGYIRGDDMEDDNTATGGRSFNSSLNFKTLNKRSLSGKNRSSKNKWIGMGQRPTLQPTLSDVRSAKIPVKIPNMYYKGNQVNLVRRGNQTTDLISSQYEP